MGRRNASRHREGTDGDGAFETGETDRLTGYGYDPITGGVTLVDSPEGVIHHEYEPGSGRLSRTYTLHSDTSYGYDGHGRLGTVTATKLNGNTVSVVTGYAYDAVGNLDMATHHMAPARPTTWCTTTTMTH